MSLLATIAIALIPAVMVFVANLVINARTLRATQPKTDAEAIDLGIGTQNEVMANLRSELERANAKSRAAEQKADALEQKVDRLEDRVNQEQKDNRHLRAENRRQMAYIRSVADWAHVHYTGPNPPPAYLPFEETP